MNVCLIQSVIRRRAAGVLAILTAAAITAIGSSQVIAQSGPLDFGPNTRIVQASAVETAADVGPNRSGPGSISQALGTSFGDVSTWNAGQVQQVGYGCQSCSRPACNGGCGACGGGGGGYSSSMACGIPCDPYRYVTVEGLYMDRNGEDNFSLSRNVQIEEFDFEFAPRITIGSLPNCFNGFEFTFVAPLEYDRILTLNAASGLNSKLTPLVEAGGNAAQPFFDFTAPFNNSQFHRQTYSSEYISGEANRTLVGWDVVKILLGFRYINIEEDYRFAAIGTGALPGGGTGLLVSQTENNLVGIQGGLDMLFPIAAHASYDFRGRAGIYANFAENNVELFNQGELQIRNAGDDTDIAGVFEFGSGLRYQLGQALTVRVGGEVWFITGVASAPDQISTVVSNGLGANIDVGDDILYYGGVASAEFRF